MNISYVIAASWLSALTAPVVDEIAANHNSQVQGKSVIVNGETISFQHHLWRINDKSVCSNHPALTPTYSTCTVKAKQLFHDLCEHLSNNNTGNKYQAQYKTMYCNAAVSYKPTIISISSDEKGFINEKEKLRLECNELTAEALGSYDKRLIKRRDEACAKVR